MQPPGVKNFFTDGSAATNWMRLRSAVAMLKPNMNTHFRSAVLPDRTNTHNASSARLELRTALPGKKAMAVGVVQLERRLLRRSFVVTQTDQNHITATSSKCS